MADNRSDGHRTGPPDQPNAVAPLGALTPAPMPPAARTDRPPRHGLGAAGDTRGAPGR